MSRVSGVSGPTTAPDAIVWAALRCDARCGAGLTCSRPGGRLQLCYPCGSASRHAGGGGPGSITTVRLDRARMSASVSRSGCRLAGPEAETSVNWPSIRAGGTAGQWRRASGWSALRPVPERLPRVPLPSRRSRRFQWCARCRLPGSLGFAHLSRVVNDILIAGPRSHNRRVPGVQLRGVPNAVDDGRRYC